MEQFGLERLCKAISNAPDYLTSGKIVEQIIDALADFLDERLLKDDVTLANGGGRLLKEQDKLV